MPQRSKVFFIFFQCVCLSFFAQHSSEYYRTRNYKDPVQFKKFHKRKRLVGAWQIRQLKEGAIVVRLKTREHLLLHLAAEPGLQQKRMIEQTVINYNISTAFRRHYHFSKVYFIYSSSSDSLLKGVRSGIFLDSNLTRDPSIGMRESYYLLVEPDYFFSSSIGFVPENEAAQQTERGHPVRRHQIVVKNKYGHQVKGPFPYTARSWGKAYPDSMEIDGVPYVILPRRANTVLIETGRSHQLTIPPEFTFDCYARAVSSFNRRLERYLLKAAKVKDVADAETQAFYY